MPSKPLPSGGCWKTSLKQPENTILLTYIVYFLWCASLIGYGYIAVRHPVLSYVRFADYAALAFWSGTWLLFSGLFVLHSFSPTAQANGAMRRRWTHGKRGLSCFLRCILGILPCFYVPLLALPCRRIRHVPAIMPRCCLRC